MQLSVEKGIKVGKEREKGRRGGRVVERGGERENDTEM